MEKPEHIYVKSVGDHGKFISINICKNTIAVLFKPDKEDTLYSVILDKDLSVDYINKIATPKEFTDMKISKVITDDYSTEVYHGVISVGRNNKTTYNKFSANINTYEIGGAVNLVDTHNVVPGVVTTKYKQIGNIIYVVGTRIINDEEHSVFIEYDLKDKVVVQEIEYYSDRGDIYLESIDVSKENLIYICGYLAVYEGDVFSHNEPYINVALK